MAAVLRIAGDTRAGITAVEGLNRALEQAKLAAQLVNEQMAAASEQASAAIRESNLIIEQSAAALADVTKRYQTQTVAGIREVMQARAREAEQLKAQIGLQQEAASAAVKGSTEQKVALQELIAMQRRYAGMLGETAAAGAAGGAGGAARGRAMTPLGLLRGPAASAEEQGIVRGVASKATGVGGFLAGPGFIAGAVSAIAAKQAIDALTRIQEETSQLQGAVKNAGLSWRGYRGQIEATVKEGERLGVTQSETLRSMTSLVRVTGSVEKAHKQYALALNIARGAHVSLDAATQAVVQADNGRFRGIQRLIGPIQAVTKYEDELKNAHIKVTNANRDTVTSLQHRAKEMDKAATQSAVMTQAEQKFSGEAERHMHTAAGAHDRLRVAVERLEISVGHGLLPVMSTLFGALARLMDWLTRSKTVSNLLHTAWLGIVTVGRPLVDLFKLVEEFLKRHTTLAKVLAATLAVVFAPFIVSAIFAVGEVKKHWAGISKFFSDIWGSIKGTAQRFWDWLVETAIKTVLKVIEPFSHLPGSMGKWARDMKDKLHEQLVNMEHDASDYGQAIGDAMGKQTYDAAVPWMNKLGKDVFKAVTSGLQQGQVMGEHGAGQGGGPGVNVPGGSVTAIARSAASAAGAGSRGFHLAGERQPYDCSAFAQAVFAQAGIHIGSNTYQQIAGGRKVAMNDLQADDLVFFNYGSERWPGHVAIYVGRGMVVHDHGASGGVSLTSFSSLASGSNHPPEARCYVASHHHKSSGGGGGASATDSTPTPTTTPTAASLGTDIASAAAVGEATSKKKKAHHKLSTAERLKRQYRPMFGQQLVNYIAGRCIHLGIDPEAVLAVASVEGGFHGKVGDQGSSFGPFQLHEDGALPSRFAGKPLEAAAWANSAEGVDYALNLIAKAVGGATGASAVNLIVSQFEHPKDVAGEVAKATGRLGSIGFRADPRAAQGGSRPGQAGAGAVQAAQNSVTAVISAANKALATAKTAISAALARLGPAFADAAKISIDAGLQATIDSAEAHLRKLRAKLGTPMTARELANTKAAIKRWETVLKDSISEASKRATAAAQIADTVRQQAYDDVMTQAQRSFDKQTHDYERAFNRATDEYVKNFEKQTQRVSDAMQVTVSGGGFGSFRFGGSITQTPAEAELQRRQDERAERDRQDAIQQAQQALADAQQGGDPAAIKKAQQDLNDALEAEAEAHLEQQAKLERDAADKQLQQAKDAYQEQRQSQLDAYQQQRQDQLESYDTMRTDAWNKMQQQLAQNQTLYDAGVEQWGDYVVNLRKALQAVGVTIPDAIINELIKEGAGPGHYAGSAAKDIKKQVAAAQDSSGTGGTPTTGGVGFQTGGFATRPQVVQIGEHEAEAVLPWSWMPPSIKKVLTNVMRERGVPGAEHIPPTRGAASGFFVPNYSHLPQEDRPDPVSTPYVPNYSHLPQEDRPPSGGTSSGGGTSTTSPVVVNPVQAAANAAAQTAAATTPALIAAVVQATADRPTSVNVNVTVLGSVAKERDIAVSIRDELVEYARQSGVKIFKGYA